MVATDIEVVEASGADAVTITSGSQPVDCEDDGFEDSELEDVAVMVDCEAESVPKMVLELVLEDEAEVWTTVEGPFVLVGYCGDSYRLEVV